MNIKQLENGCDIDLRIAEDYGFKEIKVKYLRDIEKITQLEKRRLD